jgi:hypothetical protein
MSASEDGTIIGKEIGSGHSTRVKGESGICLAIEITKERIDINVKEIGGAGSTLSEATSARKGRKTTAVDDETSSSAMSSESPHH